mgnify:CR=1 FL=1
MIKLNDPVYHPNTKEVTTIAELDDEGLIKFHKSENFENKGKTAYFADVKGTRSGWRIRKTAYLSRTNQKEKIENMFN